MKLVSKKNSRHHGEKGFTLSETAIALVIMAVVGLAASGGFVYAIRYNAGSSDRAGSLALAQSAMEKFRAVPFTDSLMTAGTTTTTAADGAGRTFSITTTVANKTVVSGKTTIKSITIQVAPVTTIGSLNSTTLDYYGSVKLYTERSNPVVGTNLN